MNDHVAARELRTTHLTGDEILEFYRNGYLRPGRILTDEGVSRMRAALERARLREHEHDLLDPGEWPDVDGGAPLEPGKSVGFLFNLWLNDEDFRGLAFSRQLAAWSAQLIGAARVRLLEDNALFKEPRTGGALKWHQDYPYWPLAQPNAVTAWVALDDVTIDNGAVQVAKGSHLTGERLPAVFGTGASYLRDQRPATVTEIAEPEAVGMEVETLTLSAGEVSFHHCLTWHASGPNITERPRRAHVVRYVADGTIWLGEQRCAYNYSDEELGLTAGDVVSGAYFPIVAA